MPNKTEVWQGTLVMMMILKALTHSVRKELAREQQDWNQTTAILARFLVAVEDPQSSHFAANKRCIAAVQIRS